MAWANWHLERRERLDAVADPIQGEFFDEASDSEERCRGYPPIRPTRAWLTDPPGGRQVYCLPPNVSLTHAIEEPRSCPQVINRREEPT